ncbi:AIPR family protein [Neorhizobium sp. S3-V5DH]|uniref:AIPR family protein n=1 Tax=Neorhizobium sp. S3-V5DH TaxID=2485166 RepID=UPI00104E3E80|nr:AIPR family protein [Neorhizobium sp. S3-V5DH]TCV76001.1 AIPR protein [Neorhizobium sp. S3-V5DH]
MSELDEYHRNLMADIRREADASGIMMVEAFFDRMSERLTEAGELDVADRAFYQNGEAAQKMRVDGYAGNPRDSEGVLGLIICDFVDSDDLQAFGKVEVKPILNPLIRFLNKARTSAFRDSLNEVSPAFQVSDLLITTWSHVTKIKLIVMSNRQYIGRDDNVKLADIGDIPVTWSVWDLARFEKFDRSGQAREDMILDIAENFGSPLPALKASQHDAALESYLAIVPGAQLASIYDRWGARLLEANVRSFLQARAKTNKGIQKTVKDEPELFFPYNNGLSATADEVTTVQTENGLAISKITNLQIVNGAQTTGSIHSALKSAKEQLSKVFVQMKLTVVPPERSEEIVPKISEFANTQNKVNAADFFSNHPFHIRMEQFSRNVIFTAREGERHDSKWFYERSRGQYINARGRLTAAQQKKFDLEFPKIQLFSKTDLAKFEFSAIGQPHVVSKGAQKNFAEFAKDIGQSWSQSDAKYDETWFRRVIAKAIIFRKLEEEVPKQGWYEGGYRANIVTYAMAKVFHDGKSERQTLDLDIVWRKQSVQDALLDALLVAARAANDEITHPPTGVRNMSEWAKQQACWNRLKEKELSYADNFNDCIVALDTARTAVRDARSEKAQTQAIMAQTEAVNLGGKFWSEVMAWGRLKKRLTPKDAQIVQICAAIPSKIPTDGQAVHAMKLLEKFRDEGFGARQPDATGV